MTFSVSTSLLFQSVLMSSCSFFSTCLMSSSLRMIFLLQSLNNSSYFLKRTILCCISSSYRRSLKNIFFNPSTVFLSRSRLYKLHWAILLWYCGRYIFWHHCSKFSFKFIVAFIQRLFRWWLFSFNWWILEVNTLFLFLIHFSFLKLMSLFFIKINFLYCIFFCSESKIILKLFYLLIIISLNLHFKLNKKNYKHNSNWPYY